LENVKNMTGKYQFKECFYPMRPSLQTVIVIPSNRI